MSDQIPASRSPYERALGDRRRSLHPRTGAYFSTIPDGHVGVGIGTFTTAGSRRAWTRPLFRIAERFGIAFAGWEEDVPFRIENRTVDGRAVAIRWFELSGRTWVMPDAVSLVSDEILRTEIGVGPSVVTTFDISTRDGAVELAVRRVGMRAGRLRLTLPRVLSPTIRLVESWDDALESHRVDMTIDAPVIGRVYEYRGTFRYAIEREQS